MLVTQNKQTLTTSQTKLEQVVCPKNLYECVVHGGTKINDIILHNHNNLIEDLFKRLVLFADVISVANNITVDKAKIISKMFYDLDNVKLCTREQLEYFFKKAFNLEYGSLYGGFGWNNLVEWFNKFYEELEESKKEIKVINKPIINTERNVIKGQEALELMTGIIDKQKQIPEFLPWLIIANYLISQNSDDFEDYVSENYDKCKANMYGMANKMIDDTRLGRKMEALKLKSEESIEDALKTKYAKEYARKYYESKFGNPASS